MSFSSCRGVSDNGEQSAAKYFFPARLYETAVTTVNAKDELELVCIHLFHCDLVEFVYFWNNVTFDIAETRNSLIQVGLPWTQIKLTTIFLWK
jgi:hypothetical protein